MDLKLFLTVFTTIFIAELGDKTQVATLLYSADATASKWLIFVAASAALILSTVITVALGGVISQYVNPRILSWVAGAGFIAVGLWTVLRA